MSERARAWLVVTAVVALLAGGLGYLRTGNGARRVRPGPAPLASPSFAPGTVGGLLPDVVLDGRNGGTPARGLRPAVLLLTRPGCGCVTVVRQVVADATPLGIVTYVITAGPVADAERVAVQAGGDAGAFADPGAVLATTYGLRTDAALVLVRSDGVVTQVVAGVAPSLRLDRSLRALLA